MLWLFRNCKTYPFDNILTLIGGKVLVYLWEGTVVLSIPSLSERWERMRTWLVSLWFSYGSVRFCKLWTGTSWSLTARFISNLMIFLTGLLLHLIGLMEFVLFFFLFWRISSIVVRLAMIKYVWREIKYKSHAFGTLERHITMIEIIKLA